MSGDTHVHMILTLYNSIIVLKVFYDLDRTSVELHYNVHSQIWGVYIISWDNRTLVRNNRDATKLL